MAESKTPAPKKQAPVKTEGATAEKKARKPVENRKTMTPIQRLALGNALVAAKADTPCRVLARDLTRSLGFEVAQSQVTAGRESLGLKPVAMPSADDLWARCEALQKQLDDQRTPAVDVES